MCKFAEFARDKKPPVLQLAACKALYHAFMNGIQSGVELKAACKESVIRARKMASSCQQHLTRRILCRHFFSFTRVGHDLKMHSMSSYKTLAEPCQQLSQSSAHIPLEQLGFKPAEQNCRLPYVQSCRLIWPSASCLTPSVIPSQSFLLSSQYHSLLASPCINRRPSLHPQEHPTNRSQHKIDV